MHLLCQMLLLPSLCGASGAETSPEVRVSQKHCTDGVRPFRLFSLPTGSFFVSKIPQCD